MKKSAAGREKSFLLETVRYYPSNHFLSYWKQIATIRETFDQLSEHQNIEERMRLPRYCGVVRK